MGFSFNPAGIIGDVIGGIIDQKEGNKNRHQADVDWQRNYDMQKEFAQNSIRWKVDDAIAAGLHPLAALGAQGYSASPSYAGGGYEGPSSMGNMARSLGQNISSSIRRTMTDDERLRVDAANERMLLENELLRTQIQKEKNQNPPMPSVIHRPVEIPMSEAGTPWQEAGGYPSVTYMRSPTGLNPVMPPMLAEALESDEMNQRKWTARYMGGPNVMPIEKPAPSKLSLFGKSPKTHGWTWSYPLQEWRPTSHKEAEYRARRSFSDKYNYERQSGKFRKLRDEDWKIGR
nr:MAG: DNA pilot protein [Microvirus sp.]